MKRRYAVQHGDTITVFKDRLVEAIEYWQARPGSVLVYKAHGRWGGQEKRSTRWLRVPWEHSAYASPKDALSAMHKEKSQ